MIIDEQYQHFFYIHIDDEGNAVDGGYVDPQNVWYILGRTWEVTLEDINAAGIAPVIDSNKVFTNGEGVIEVLMGELVNNNDGTFTQQWIEQEISADEKRMRFLERSRFNLLFESDWTQVADAPLTDAVKEEWRTYRQALRDLPAGIDWDSIKSSADINWPRVPGAVVEPNADEAAAAAQADGAPIPRDPETGEPL